MTHGSLGDQFIESARMIGLNSEESVTALCVDPSDSPEQLKDRLATAIKRANSGRGVLILTDLFGGTPTNLSISFLAEGKVEVVTGLNLPMLIKAINSREINDLSDLARLTAEAGKEAIFLAGTAMPARRPKRDRR